MYAMRANISSIIEPCMLNFIRNSNNDIILFIYILQQKPSLKGYKANIFIYVEFKVSALCSLIRQKSNKLYPIIMVFRVFKRS